MAVGDKSSKALKPFLLWLKCRQFMYRKQQHCNVGYFYYFIWFLLNTHCLCFSLVLLRSKTHYFFVPPLSMRTRSCWEQSLHNGIV